MYELKIVEPMNGPEDAERWFLQTYFDYDDAGYLIHRDGPNSGNRLAISLSDQGYRRSTIDGKRDYHHVLICRYHHGDVPTGFVVDHIVGVSEGGSDQIENLRLATHRQNTLNAKMSKLNTSGYRGVTTSADDKKYVARIKVNRKQIYIGTFDTAEDAARAYDKATIEYNGTEFSRTNFPISDYKL